jgi:hypothetical protein
VRKLLVILEKSSCFGVLSVPILIFYLLGPVVRLTPTQLIVNDATRIPDIYHRQANKSLFYINGSFGIVESAFNIRDWRTHAYHRKLIAAPVSYCLFSSVIVNSINVIGHHFPSMLTDHKQYSFTNIKRMEPLVDERVAHWIRKIDELFVKTGKSLNFTAWAT